MTNKQKEELKLHKLKMLNQEKLHLKEEFRNLLQELKQRVIQKLQQQLEDHLLKDQYKDLLQGKLFSQKEAEILQEAVIIAEINRKNLVSQNSGYSLDYM